MAKSTIVTITSDLSQGEDAKTVKFGYKGVNYEIDITDDEDSALEEFLAPYIGAGTRVATPLYAGSTSTVSSRRQYGTGPARKDTKHIREWLTDNGTEISDRGRIPKADMARYDEWERSNGGRHYQRPFSMEGNPSRTAAPALAATPTAPQPEPQAQTPIGDPKPMELPETSEEPTDAQLLEVYNAAVKRSGGKAIKRISTPTQRSTAMQNWHAHQMATKTPVSV